MALENKFRTALSERNLAIGTWLQSGSVEACETAAKAGMDFNLIDMEHGHFGFETAVNMLRGSQCFGAATILRVPAPTPHFIMQALDAGADGVIIPNVGSAKVVESAVVSAKYGPGGRRGACPCVRATGHGVTDWDEYLDYCDENITVACIIETVEGVENFDEIIAVDGLDFIALGSVDLTVAMGHRGDYKRPEITTIFERLVDKALARGIDLMVGTFAYDPEAIAKHLEYWTARGVRVHNLSGDRFMMSAAFSGITSTASRFARPGIRAGAE